MSLKHLIDAIGDLDEELLTEVGRLRAKGKGGLSAWPRVVAIAAALGLVVGSFFIAQIFIRKSNVEVAAVTVLADPVFPEMSEYPQEKDYILSNGDFDDESYDRMYDAWHADLMRQRDQIPDYQSGLLAFVQRTIPAVLTEDGSENRLYSPLNMYINLCLLSEAAGGETRAELLSLLELDSIEQVRQKAKALWNAHYIDDGYMKSLLANSIWLDNSLSTNKESIEILADIYKASIFQGDMQSQELLDQLQHWLNKHTDNLLEQNTKGLDFDQDTLMALASTLLYRAKWVTEFSTAMTTSDIFHTPDGEVQADFMSRSNPDNYYWGDDFGAVKQGIYNSGQMWFFLPDEGVSVEKLLENPQVYSLLQDENEYKQQKQLIVNFKLPKFDVNCDISLEETLRELGLETAFSPQKANFSSISSQASLYVSSISQASRVLIDEKGVTGAAYTVNICGAVKPPDEFVDVVLDRPFLFVIQGHDDVPLFIGIVNSP